MHFPDPVAVYTVPSGTRPQLYGPAVDRCTSSWDITYPPPPPISCFISLLERFEVFIQKNGEVCVCNKGIRCTGKIERVYKYKYNKRRLKSTDTVRES